MESCKSIEKLLISFIDGELSHKESEGVSYHIGQCKRCKAEYELYQRVISALSREEERTILGEDFVEGTLKNILAQKMREKSLLKTVLNLFFIRITFHFGVRANILFRWR
jgi:anti-sigma factor RsiW